MPGFSVADSARSDRLRSRGEAVSRTSGSAAGARRGGQAVRASRFDYAGQSSQSVRSGYRASVPEQAPRNEAREDAQSASASASFADRLSAKLAHAKKARAKSKAERSFTQQYGASDASTSASAESAGPRAAVYKGEMGVAHKKATRMQGSEAGRSARSAQPSPKRDRIKHPIFAASAAAMACLLFCCAFLYGPAQQYYQEIRERDRLAAEFAAIEQRNEAIQSAVDFLSTSEGIEDRARTEFGWVKSDEQAGTVSGINVVETSNFTATVVPGSVKAPETWYSGVLDPLFGVE